jgi:hypothetical protein
MHSLPAGQQVAGWPHSVPPAQSSPPVSVSVSVAEAFSVVPVDVSVADVGEPVGSPVVTPVMLSPTVASVSSVGPEVVGGGPSVVSTPVPVVCDPTVSVASLAPPVPPAPSSPQAATPAPSNTQPRTRPVQCPARIGPAKHGPAGRSTAFTGRHGRRARARACSGAGRKIGERRNPPA